MEETVIWEQHTVTLHRVGVCSVVFASIICKGVFNLSHYSSIGFYFGEKRQKSSCYIISVYLFLFGAYFVCSCKAKSVYELA